MSYERLSSEASNNIMFDSFEQGQIHEDDTRLASTSSDNSTSTTSTTQPQIQPQEQPHESTSSSLPEDLEPGVTTPRTSRATDIRQRITRLLHSVIPIRQTYERINNGLTTGRMQSNQPGRFIGQGTDGVFRNLAAKPDTQSSLQLKETNPPSYEEAAADAAPEYWESSVISPMYEDEVFVEGLPVGNIANFIWNALVTIAFQFVGFVLCYLLHTSHAAKHGSRAGLGITMIMYGWSIVPTNFGNPDKVPSRIIPNDPNYFDIDKSTRIGGKVDKYVVTGVSAGDDSGSLDSANAPYVAYGLVALGLFIIIKSLVDYYRVKKTEREILQPRAAAVAAAAAAATATESSATGDATGEPSIFPTTTETTGETTLPV
ncbi:Metal homeostatis protein BSD2 [Spathaspora sp. JA1]|nr:Metal homeostatis protein BSD2 [Spathaspora sp. JA1]